MRYAVLTDIHANFKALQAVLNDLPEDVLIWVLGDIVGYGPAEQAAKCIEWLRFQSGVEERWIPGNHDECIVNSIRLASRDATTTLAVQHEFLQRARTQSDWKWFCDHVGNIIHNSLKEGTLEIEDEKGSLVFEKFKATEEYPDLTLAFSHASVAKSERRLSYLYPWLRELLRDELRLLRSLDMAPTICLLHGHTHFPSFVHLNPLGELILLSIKYGKEVNLDEGNYLICPGSVGQPRDGDPRAAYMLVNPIERTVEFRRVKYDIEEVVRDLERERGNRETYSALERVGVKLEFPGPDGQTLVYPNYYHLARSTYESLISRLRTGNGGDYLGEYNSKAYRPPEWDLEAINSS